MKSTAKSEKKKRGFAAMSPEKQREIASKGGKAHDREHLAEIGARGGKARGVNAAARNKPQA